MCGYNDTERVPVWITPDLSHTGKGYEKMAAIDRCLAPIVRALSEGKDVPHMRSSCCGHGKMDGHIVFEDGLTLIIKGPQ